RTRPWPRGTLTFQASYWAPDRRQSADDRTATEIAPPHGLYVTPTFDCSVSTDVHLQDLADCSCARTCGERLEGRLEWVSAVSTPYPIMPMVGLADDIDRVD